MGVSGDFIVRNMNLKQPDYLKIDVRSSVEHNILSGMKETLPKVKSILTRLVILKKEQLNTTQSFES